MSFRRFLYIKAKNERFSSPLRVKENKNLENLSLFWFFPYTFLPFRFFPLISAASSAITIPLTQTLKIPTKKQPTKPSECRFFHSFDYQCMFWVFHSIFVTKKYNKQHDKRTNIHSFKHKTWFVSNWWKIIQRLALTALYYNRPTARSP